MEVLKVKTPLVHVHLKLFKAGILNVLQVSGRKKNDEVSVIVSVFRKPKAFEIFFPPREVTPPSSSAKRLDIKIPSPFPYKFDKTVPWGYEPTTTMMSCVILQDNANEGPRFVTNEGSSQRTPNWTSMDIPEVMHVLE
ncbi:hypothetical protein KIW84_055538 [Lathyrus oleraceus]|uniref:Uncharacterized protein n=1 Tax=Pisum sativum TaxID=3888 RepID=A0A9D5AJW3_PEA|nr:hypothetical protein KIW84_055538 [Pisum sativum]